MIAKQNKLVCENKSCQTETANTLQFGSLAKLGKVPAKHPVDLLFGSLAAVLSTAALPNYPPNREKNTGDTIITWPTLAIWTQSSWLAKLHSRFTFASCFTRSAHEALPKKSDRYGDNSDQCQRIVTRLSHTVSSVSKRYDTNRRVTNDMSRVVSTQGSTNLAKWPGTSNLSIMVILYKFDRTNCPTQTV